MFRFVLLVELRVITSAIPPICRNWQNAYIISLSKELEALESQVLWCIQGIAHQVRRKNWLHKSYNCLPARPSYDEQYLHLTNVIVVRNASLLDIHL